MGAFVAIIIVLVASIILVIVLAVFFLRRLKIKTRSDSKNTASYNTSTNHVVMSDGPSDETSGEDSDCGTESTAIFYNKSNNGNTESDLRD